jgi:hypothetical protein
MSKSVSFFCQELPSYRCAKPSRARMSKSVRSFCQEPPSYLCLADGWPDPLILFKPIKTFPFFTSVTFFYRRASEPLLDIR